MNRSIALLVVALVTFSAEEVIANGAAHRPGIGGSNIVIYDGMPQANLVVDEFVDIDMDKDYVNVNYIITNPTGKEVNLAMAFPVTQMSGERGECPSLDNASWYDPSNEETVAQYFDFHVTLNKRELEAKRRAASDVALPAGYRDLNSMACSFYTFLAPLQKGYNALSIRYRLVSEYRGADGMGDTWNFEYPIWPAKNWIKSFRVAKWRVIAPRALAAEMRVQSDNLHNADNSGRHLTFTVKAPGSKFVRDGEYIFTATKFAPAGSVEISMETRDESSLVDECTEENARTCWKKSLASFLEIRKYHGSERCYFPGDLAAIIINRGQDVPDMESHADALPYLKNEIFARRGYSFSNDEFRGFFGALQWYFPQSDRVELSEIEQFNVKYILESEKAMREGKEEYVNSRADETLARERSRVCPKH